MTTSKKISFSIIAALLFSITAPGQNDLDKIRASFNEHVKNNTSESVFAQTDKEFYLAGEILWFKIYVASPDNIEPVDISKLAYVEIIGADQKPVLQSKIALSDGKGNGSLYLPVSINTGVYKLRAYTNWIKNFGADLFFEKQLPIINTLKTLPVLSTAAPSYHVEFYPEGGNLVQNLESTVAFKMADQTGKGAEGKGFVIRNENDTVTTFQPSKFGIGKFRFTPQAGSSYKAVIKFKDTVITKELPRALQEGYVLNLAGVTEPEFKLNIVRNYRSDDLVYVLVHTNDQIEILEKIALKDNGAEFRIPKNKLAEGISYVRILNRDMATVGERLFFVRPQRKMIIETNAGKEKYGTRKQIKMPVNTTDETGKAITADVSVAVYRLDTLDMNKNYSIENYFWFTSGLKGPVESPGYYFSDSNREVIEATDNLMLTQQGRSRWHDPFDGKQDYSFPPEYAGHIIYCKVSDKKSATPSPGVLVYLSVPGNRVQLYSSVSDQNGIAKFYTRDFYGSNEIVLQTDSLASKYKLEIVSPFSDSFSQEKLQPFELKKNMESLLKDYSAGMQIVNSYHAEKLKSFETPTLDTSAFFGVPDKRYKLDDYTRFSTMEEVLREYVMEVLVRRQKENFRFIMSDIDNKQFYDDPFTLFNGVPVFDPNKIIKYDPLKVKEIDVVKNRYFFGPLILNGVVNFITYDPDPSMLSDLNAMVLEYEGMQYQRQFYSPAYEDEAASSSRIPDFRGLLYWSPGIQTDTNGKAEINFFTSDMKGKYVVVIQGLTNDGRVGVKSLSFDVE